MTIYTNIMENTSFIKNESLNDTVLVPGGGGFVWSWEYIGLAAFLTVCAVVGILGNLAILVVYFDRKDHTTFNTFIKVLAFLDLQVCLLIIPYTMVYELHMVRNDILCRLFEFLRHFVICASNITIVAIAVERYLAVCKLTHRMSVRTVNQGIAIIAVFSVVFATPSIAMFAVVSNDDVKGLRCAYDHSPTTRGNYCHFTYGIIGETLTTLYQKLLTILFVITLVLIISFYSILYSVLWKKYKFRKQTRTATKDSSATTEHNQSCDNNNTKKNLELVYSKLHIHKGGFNDIFRRKKTNSKIRRRNHRKTAKMLFLCTVIYILTWLPFWFDIFGWTHNLILRYLFFLGNATNPIVYGIVNSQVRRSLKNVLCSYFGNFNFQTKV